jgi:ubiquitin-conjugating enzyme E2 variant
MLRRTQFPSKRSRALGFLSEHGRYGYSRGHRLVELSSITLFFLTLLYLNIRLVQGLRGISQALPLLLCAVAGILVADLASGIVHWAGDTLGDERTPIVGRHFIMPFRLHHVDPRDICRHDFIETNGNNCLVALAVLIPMSILMPSEAGGLYYLGAVVASTAWFVFCTNQFHKWSHLDDPPWYIRFLQWTRLALGREHHAIHHAHPHDKYYCITVGWLNPLLHRLRFFRGLEALVARWRPGILHIEERSQPPPAGAGSPI